LQPVANSSFALLANGSPEGPPAAPLAQLLLEWGARRVTTVFHPLDSRDSDGHETTTYDSGRARRRRLRLPSATPYTYPLDLLVPPVLAPVDGWFAFNNLLAAQGLATRAAGRARTVVYSAVDFVPDRFGTGPLTRAFDAVDRFVCRRCDARFEVSEAALAARDARLGLDRVTTIPAAVVPIGAWAGRVPRTPPDGIGARKIVFAGHLVERQGVSTLLQALALLRRRGVEFSAEISGRGPLSQALQQRATALGLDDRVNWLGFLPTHRDVERFLASGSVGVAPYDTAADSFTRFADPGKLKAYAAAGLPIVTTRVAPNVQELEREAGATISDFAPEPLADQIEATLADPERWSVRREMALNYARRFDWPAIYTRALAIAGFSTPAAA
jgi:glycosyltransferase involved in cell wall biosynthesis